MLFRDEMEWSTLEYFATYKGDYKGDPVMSLLKGNYKLNDVPEGVAEDVSAEKLLEQQYYKEALSKLGGSISFIMKDKTFLWTGDDAAESAPAGKDKKTKS